MAKNNLRDFMGDEKWDEMQEQLFEAKIQTQKHIAANEQSKANLELFEEITANSAIQLAEQQSALSELSQKLSEAKAELGRQTQLMQQQEALNKSKAYTLRAAQKELEECQIRYCKTLETVKNINEQITEYEDAIEKASIKVKSAYNNWQHNYNHLQEQKLVAEQNDRTLQQLQAKINNISHKQELSKNRAADQVADSVIESLEQDLDITDFHIMDLPKATLENKPVIPEIPPIDDDLAALIKEATANNDSEYQSLRHETAPINKAINDEPKAETTTETKVEEIVKEQKLDDDQTKKAEEDFWENQTKSTFASANVFAKPHTNKEVHISENDLNSDEEISGKNYQTAATTPILPKDDKLAAEINKILEVTSEPEPKQESAVQEQLQPENPNDDKVSEATPKKKSSVKGYIICIILAIIIAVALRMFVFQITEISGDSMQPTLNSGERIISSTISYQIGEVEKGDIIIFTAPDRTDNAYYVKRVIGMPGDHVIINDGLVTVNNTVISENYLEEDYTEGYVDTIVPEDEYFVLGDNRAVSHDSRNPDVSTIPENSILGKAVFTIFPFSEMGTIK